MFPELEEAIKEGRSEMSAGITWKDQSSKAYQDECVKQTEKLIGPKVTPSQRKGLVERIIKPFSICLWMTGCFAPRIEGFTADINLKSDAQPMIKQPYKLSEFDQRRLEFHEDKEVAEGKAVWAKPGHKASWGSPSFVVDLAGKGVLGRPVRDYR